MPVGRVELERRQNLGSMALHAAFRGHYYLVRRQVFKIFGAGFHIYDENDNLLLYSKELPFRLWDDFRVYADESQADELLNIKTPQFFEFAAVFNVQDSHTGEAVGAVARKGFRSMVRDEWHFLANNGAEIGRLVESETSALTSRFLSNWIPQNYEIVAWDGRRVAEIVQHFNPFILKYSLNISDPDPPIDRRLLLAAGLLLAGVEGRQKEIFGMGDLGVGSLLMGPHRTPGIDVGAAGGDLNSVDDDSALGDLIGLGSSILDDGE